MKIWQIAFLSIALIVIIGGFTVGSEKLYDVIFPPPAPIVAHSTGKLQQNASHAPSNITSGEKSLQDAYNQALVAWPDAMTSGTDPVDIPSLSLDRRAKVETFNPLMQNRRFTSGPAVVSASDAVKSGTVGVSDATERYYAATDGPSWRR